MQEGRRLVRLSFLVALLAAGPAAGRGRRGRLRRPPRASRRGSRATRPARPPSSSPAPTAKGSLNRGVALLYAGDVAAAERELLALRAREPRFTPALRWLARAQAKAGDPGLEATLSALLADSGADSRDFLWAGQFQLEGGQADRAAGNLRAAVLREPDLYLGWLWLGDAEAARGRDHEAREAWLRARELHAGGDVLWRLGEGSLRAGRQQEGRAFLEEALGTPEGRLREEEIRAARPGPAGRALRLCPSPRRSSPASACATAPVISSSASRRSRWRTRASRRSGGGVPPGSSSRCAPTPASRSSPSTAGSRA